MKKSKEIVGLPVLDITGGNLLGKIESLLIDPEAGAVACLLLERPKWYLEMRVLDYPKVVGIGDYAVTTEKKDNVSLVTRNERALGLLEKDVKVLEAKVLSDKGKMLGTVKEIVIDESTGRIEGCEIAPVNGNKQWQSVARNYILTFGQNYLVIKEAGGEEVSPDQDILDFFKEEQQKFLLGRRSAKTIKDRSGNVIVEEGQLIDEAVIKKAQETDTYIELSMFAE